MCCLFLMSPQIGIALGRAFVVVERHTG
jgi:hypothetical protein